MLAKMSNRILFCILSLSALCISGALAGVSREQMEKISQGFRNSCTNKVKADPELVAGVRNGVFTEGDTAVKCYTRCIMGLMKTFKDGKVDLPALLKQINIMAADEIVDRLSNVAKTCHAQINDEDPCEYTWNFLKCTYNGDPEIYFFP